MAKGNRRRTWKAQADRKRAPGGYMPPMPKHNQQRPGNVGTGETTIND